MAKIEIGDVVIKKDDVLDLGDSVDGTIKLRVCQREVRADFRFCGEDGSGTANFGLLMEHHPELEKHCDAVRHYMKQQARRLLSE